jgi:hypothetical protein
MCQETHTLHNCGHTKVYKEACSPGYKCNTDLVVVNNEGEEPCCASDRQELLSDEADRHREIGLSGPERLELKKEEEEKTNRRLAKWRLEQKEAREQERKLAMKRWTILALIPLALFFSLLSTALEDSGQNQKIAAALYMTLAGAGALALALKCLSKALAAALDGR